MDLALNNLQWLTCHKNQPNQKENSYYNSQNLHQNYCQLQHISQKTLQKTNMAGLKSKSLQQNRQPEMKIWILALPYKNDFTP